MKGRWEGLGAGVFSAGVGLGLSCEEGTVHGGGARGFADGAAGTSPDDLTTFRSGREEAAWPILICLLGSFRLLKCGQAVGVRSGGKGEALLANLALGQPHGVAREALLEALWPGSEPLLAGQSLNSLVYSLHRLLGDAIGDAAPIMYRDGRYLLNSEVGVAVDVAHFGALVQAGDRLARGGDVSAAVNPYRRAVDLYRGDLCVGSDVRAVVERERLRGQYLTLLARLADYHYQQDDSLECLSYALRLLANDPCREDAHRVVMRCCVRRGERAQALHQYRVCEQILRAEFDARPESATTALFDQIRTDPDSI